MANVSQTNLGWNRETGVVASAGQSPPSLDRLRERVRELVAESDARGVSRLAGVSVSTLQRFLAGRSSSGRTRYKLFELVVASALAADETALGTFWVLRALVAAIPEDLRASAIVRIGDTFHMVFQEHTGGSPLWLLQLSAAFDRVCEPPRLDDEQIAALLDGRLTGADRQHALAVLAGGAEDQFRVFADAARLLREREAGEGVS